MLMLFEISNQIVFYHETHLLIGPWVNCLSWCYLNFQIKLVSILNCVVPNLSVNWHLLG